MATIRLIREYRRGLLIALSGPTLVTLYIVMEAREYNGQFVNHILSRPIEHLAIVAFLPILILAGAMAEFSRRRSATMLTTARELAEKAVQVKRSAEHLAALQRLSTNVATSLELSRVLQSVAETAATLTGADAATVHLHDPATGQLTSRAGQWGRLGEEIPLPRRHGITAWVARNGQPIVIGDAQGRSLPADGIKLPGRLKAIASFPLKPGEQVLGVLDVLFHRPMSFSDEDIRVLSIFADQAAMAVEKAQLFTQMQRTLDNITRLYELGSALGTRLSPEEIPGLVIEAASKALGASAASIARWDERAGRLEYTAAKGLPKQMLETPFRADGVAARALRENQARFVADIKRTDQDLAPVVRAAPFRAFACLPMVTGERKVGVLHVNYTEPHHFSDTEMQMLSIFANQAAIALENARLYQEVSQAYGRLKASHEQLLEAERTKALMELAGATAHELNQPLTVILGYINLMALEKDLKADPAMLESIRSQAQRMSEIVRQLSSITRYETKPYAGQQRIIDLERAARQGPESNGRDGQPPAPASPAG